MTTPPASALLLRQGADVHAAADDEVHQAGADGFIGRSNVIGSDGKPAVIETVYRRVK